MSHLRAWRPRRAAARRPAAEALEARFVLAADLIGTSFNVAPDQLTGPTISVTYTLKNQNVVPFLDDAGSFTVGFYLSDDSTISTSDILIGFDSVPGLGAGQSVSGSAVLASGPGASMPTEDPFRTDNLYFIGMIVDDTGRVTESNESNNRNRGQGLDRDDIGAEHDLPNPADGVNVRSRPLAFDGTTTSSFGDEWIGPDEDIFQFNVTAGQTLGFDLDTIAAVDGYLRLYDSSFRLLDADDNTPAPGESPGNQPFLAHTFPAAGTFFLVVSGAADRNTDPRRLTGRTANVGGTYSIETRFIPAAPSAPDMLSSSDTGESNSDNITRDDTPAFVVVGEPGGKAELYANGVRVGEDPAGTSRGVYLVRPGLGLSDGEYDITATIVNSSGREGIPSAATHVLIDTVARGVSQPFLSAASDTGRSNSDGITSDNTPDLTGGALDSSESVVTLLVNGTATQTTQVGPQGAWVFHLTTPLADGSYLFAATSTDRAGNVSAALPGKTVVIDTAAPATPPVPDLTAASDTGRSDSDDVTSNKTPTLAGATEPRARLRFTRDGGTAPFLLDARADGSWSQQIGTLNDGVHTFAVNVVDEAGNESARSPALSFTVDTVAPAAPHPPTLDPASDSGASAFDHVTNVTTPVIVIEHSEPDVLAQVLSGDVVVAEGPVENGVARLQVQPQADGFHTFQARAVDRAGNLSRVDLGVSVVIDTAPPRVLSATAAATDTSVTVRYTFSESVSQGLTAGALIARDVQTGHELSGFQLAVDPDGKGATFTLTAAAGVGLPAGTYEAVLAAQRVRDAAGNALAEDSHVPFDVPPPPAGTVVGRSVFYNHSAFDGNDAGLGPADDAAVAPDKSALLPGQSATFANVTTYARGINGIMVDIAGLPADGPTAEDVLLRAGNDADPSGWVPPVLPAPPAVGLRRSAGPGGSDRLSISLPDGTIKNTWLQVTLLATPRTGLAAPDVFYFGNLVGDAGDGAATFRVNAIDIAGVKRALNTTATVGARFDFNRDGRVNALDLAAVRLNMNRSLITLAASVTAAPSAPGVSFLERATEEAPTRLLR